MFCIEFDLIRHVDQWQKSDRTQMEPAKDIISRSLSSCFIIETNILRQYLLLFFVIVRVMFKDILLTRNRSKVISLQLPEVPSSTFEIKLQIENQILSLSLSLFIDWINVSTRKIFCRELTNTADHLWSSRDLSQSNSNRAEQTRKSLRSSAIACPT